MKQIFKFCLASILTIAMASGCKKDPNPDFPLSFDLKLLNQNGIPSTSFKKGENFIFSFSVTNNSNTDLYLEKSVPTNFLDVNRIYTSSENNSESIIYIGKPYKSVYCEFKNGRGVKIPANNTLKLEIPWVTDSVNAICCDFYCVPPKYNDFLLEGNYRTGFSGSFTVNSEVKGYKSDLVSSDISFKVIP